MVSFSGLGIGLSFGFGCILLLLVAELYYLFYWKKRFTNREIEDQYTSIATEISQIFCGKKPNPVSKISTHHQNHASVFRNSEPINGHEQDLELRGYGENGVEAELMRLHNLCGPPRFLFTIKEETKEDLESDDGKSKDNDKSRKGSRTRSLSDIIIAVDSHTPFLSPLSSPPMKAHNLDSYNRHGFNPLFESNPDAELNRLRSSPPPKFKFLRDAEEKLMKRLLEEAEKRVIKNGGSVQDSAIKASLSSNAVTHERDGSILSVIGKNKEEKLHQQLPIYHSAPSQILPLASSPSTFRPLVQKPGVQ